MNIRDCIAIVEAEMVTEKAPPGKAAATWIKHRKTEFEARYGKHWKRVLYAAAWKRFG